MARADWRIIPLPCPPRTVVPTEHSLLRSINSLRDETAIEIFHKFQLSPWLSLKPVLQYIFNPGGDGRDAIVVGARVEIAF